MQENKFLAYGALVGGPQVDDSFEDSRGWCCAAYNEVAIDYNAGFTGAIARLVLYYQDQKLFSDCGLDLGWDHPNATLVSLIPLFRIFFLKHILGDTPNSRDVAGVSSGLFWTEHLPRAT